jgi:hypothetical protein
LLTFKQSRVTSPGRRGGAHRKLGGNAAVAVAWTAETGGDGAARFRDAANRQDY